MSEVWTISRLYSDVGSLSTCLIILSVDPASTDIVQIFYVYLNKNLFNDICILGKYCNKRVIPVALPLALPIISQVRSKKKKGVRSHFRWIDIKRSNASLRKPETPPVNEIRRKSSFDLLVVWEGAFLQISTDRR